jgi:hypothetical protein
MGGTKHGQMKSEVTQAIEALPPHYRLDVGAFGDQFGAPERTSRLWGTLLPATPVNRADAISWVNGPATNPGGGTPMYLALESTCALYSPGLKTLALVTDGYANTGGGANQILTDIPQWWSAFDNCQLNAVCIGAGGATFVQSLVALVGGSYIAI